MTDKWEKLRDAVSKRIGKCGDGSIRGSAAQIESFRTVLRAMEQLDNEEAGRSLAEAGY